MTRAAMFLALLAGCARPTHPNPYVPPETQYSVGSTVLAAGGLVAASVGAQVAQTPGASASARTAGTAAMGAGAGLMAASLIDAIEVHKEREKFIKLTRAFYHHYFGYDPLEEAKERPAPPPIPEVPFNFKDPSEDQDP
jgi:hypothetical protein